MRLYLLELGVIPNLKNAPVPGYLIRTDDGTNVLVDTGFPAEGPPGMPVRVGPEHGLLALLSTLDVTPADVRYVVCSHLDPDHAGNHDLFPEAEFVVQRGHYELARSGTVKRLELAREHWDQPHLKYQLVDGDTELLPGIELIETSGHVPGHQSVLVRLPETGPVLLAVDAVPMELAADPATRPITPMDLDEESTRRSTGKLADLVTAEHVALTVYGHDARQWPTLKRAPEFYA